MRMPAGLRIDRLRSLVAGRALRNLAVLFLSSGVSRGAQLLLAVVAARAFGVQGYGAFVFATSTAIFCSFIAALGWPNLMNRVIPLLLRDREFGHLRGVLRAGDVVALAASAVFAMGLLAAAAIFSDYAIGLELAALLTFPYVLAALRRQQLAAVKRSALGMMFDQGFASLAVIPALLLFALDVRSTVVVFAAALLIGVGIATVIVRRLLPAEMAGAARRYRWKEWSTLALPMMVGQSAKLIMSRMDVLLLVPLAGLAQAGLYGAAFRLTYLLTFPQALLAMITMPLFSEAFAVGNRQRVTALLRRASLFSVVTSAPILLPLLLAPEWVMETLFGAQFSGAAAILVILAVGQVATAFSIPYQSILMMGGGERGFGVVNVIVMAMNLIACLMLIPAYGAEGAAFVTSATGFVLFVGQVVLSRRLLRRRDFAGPRDAGAVG